MGGIMLPEDIDGTQRFRPFRILWRILDHPDSSCMAKCFALLSVTIIVVSILMLIIESLPSFMESQEDDEKDNTTVHQMNATTSTAEVCRMISVYTGNFNPPPSRFKVAKPWAKSTIGG